MKNYKKIVILTVLFAFLSILIYHYYINVCNTSIEFFNEKIEDKNPKKKDKNPKIVGEQVLAAREALINMAGAAEKAINESKKALKVISNQPL
tara:strand:+ start:1138 stop:1416 length:279 start_codon:yes stop_codon:yes gene_type:complete